MTVIRILLFIMGLAIVVRTMMSAVYTLVLPRSSPDIIAGTVFTFLRHLVELRLRWADTYAQRDRIMALYAPIALLTLLPVWLSLTLVGFMLMYRATGINDWNAGFTVSGSSLLTLGFASSHNSIHILLAFAEATIGLIFVALLIAYLPTIYSVFSRREVAVSQLASRAGTPPSAAEMILRVHRLGALDRLQGFWESWEQLFAEIDESHTSLTVLVFLRSPRPEQSWLTASGTVLDVAALLSSTVDIPRNPQSELCIRAGFLALRHIADFFDIDHNPDPHYANDPISITRQEFDEVCLRLAEGGVPLRRDRDSAWSDFAGWRVNYDRVLVSLCALTMAPYASWSSDRSVPRKL